MPIRKLSRKRNFKIKVLEQKKPSVYFIILLFFSLLKKGKKLKYLNFLFKSLKLLSMRFFGFSIFRLIKTLFIFIYPRVYFKVIRVGRRKHSVPLVSNFKLSTLLAVKWVLISIRKRTERTLILKLYAEFKEILEKKATNTIKEKQSHYLNVYQTRYKVRFFKWWINRKKQTKIRR